jgi:DNA polymerase-3 subunit delta'
MLFSEIIGQQNCKERLIQSVQLSRISHAQLLRGPSGIGKLGLALAYAQYISCQHPTPTDSCGTCTSCVKYNKLAHPDLHFVFPVIKPSGKTSVVCNDFLDKFRAMVLKSPYFGLTEWYESIAGDAKQGLIYANESEEIVRKLSLKTYESEYKIMVIWQPEKMHVSCANKLLKILEEPPEKTLFLLVSDNPDQIITTILSRTQHIIVPRLNNEEIVNCLIQKHDKDIPLQDAVDAARVANGSYLHALKILLENDENKVQFEKFTLLMRLAWSVGNKNDHASLKTLRKWSEDIAASEVGRERQKNFLNYAQKMTRENFIKNLQQPDLNYLNSNETDFSDKFSPFINERNVEDIMAEFYLAERHIEQNVNAKMVFFDLALKIICS